MFEHLKAGDNVELLWHFFCQRLSRDLAVVNIHARFELMQSCHCQRGFAHVDAHHGGAALSHRLAQNSAATPHVQHFFASQLHALVNPVDTQRVNVVQWFELAFAVPPAIGKRLKFGDLGVVDVAHG